MTSTIYSVLAYALIPAGTVIAGGALATLRPPGPKVRSAVQHLVARADSRTTGNLFIQIWLKPVLVRLDFAVCDY